MSKEEQKEAIEKIAKIISKYHIGCNLPIECNTGCELCGAKALYDAGYRLPSEGKPPEEVAEAVKAERERIRHKLNNQNASDAKEWETGTGGHLYKVLLFTKDEWSKFWQALLTSE